MKKQLSVFSIAMLIFIAVFGFGNIPNNYAKLGPSSFTWFVMLGIFFVPVALMIAEMTSLHSKSSAGITSWIRDGIGENWAFIGSWSYFVGTIFYLPTLVARIPVFFSWVVGNYTYNDVNGLASGHSIPGIITATENKELFVTIIIIAIIIAGFIQLRHEELFSALSKYTGIISLVAAGLFIVLAFATVLFLGKAPATEVTWSNYTPSFGPETWSAIAWLIFAIAGVETIGSFVNKVDHPERKVPKGIMVASLIVVLGYALGTLSLTFISKADQLPTGNLEQLLPLMYAQLFESYGIGEWALRIMMGSYLCVTIVAVILWSLANIKVFLSEAPSFIVPEKFLKNNEFGTPVYGVIFQSILIMLFILIINYGGSSLGNIYLVMYNMSTMAILLPFIIIFSAYIGYRVKGVKAPYQMVKNDRLAIIIALIVLVIIIFAFCAIGWDFTVFFTNDEVARNAAIEQAKLYFGGLGFFVLIGVTWYYVALSKSKSKVKQS